MALSKKPMANIHASSIVSRPLSPDGKTPVEGIRYSGRWKRGQDSVAMNDLIGKAERSVVTSAKGEKYMLHEPTLADYITLCDRVVTPVRVDAIFQLGQC